MHTLELKISDKYINRVLDILKSLKDDMIYEINIKTEDKNSINSDLEEFYRLIGGANNPIKLNYLNATNTDEMIDNIF
jgi:hypothetical protein